MPDSRGALDLLLVGLQRIEIIIGEMFQQPTHPGVVVKLTCLDGLEHVAGHLGVTAQEDAALVTGFFPAFQKCMHVVDCYLMIGHYLTALIKSASMP